MMIPEKKDKQKVYMMIAIIILSIGLIYSAIGNYIYKEELKSLCEYRNSEAEFTNQLIYIIENVTEDDYWDNLTMFNCTGE